MFLTQIPSSIPEEERPSLQISMSSTRITFSPEDMQVLEKHDKPLYFASYLGSTEVNCILVDPRSALNIMSHRDMKHLGFPASWLNSIDTVIYGFNANGACSLGKIRLKC